MTEFWVIQRDDGELFCDIDIVEIGYKAYYTNHIEQCFYNHSIFRTQELAQSYINNFLEENCKPVRIKIEIVGEEEC